MNPIDPKLLQVGQPLTQSLFDAKGRLLLKEGRVLEPAQLSALRGHRLFVDQSAQADVRSGSSAKLETAVEPRSQHNLEEIRPTCGETWHVQVQDETGQRLMARFIGFFQGASVLLSLPVLDGQFVRIPEGTPLIVRFFSGRSAYAFSAFVMKSAIAPFPYLHLTYPPKVSGLQVRKSHRLDLRLPVTLKSQDGLFFDASSLNMSKGGALVRSSKHASQKGHRVLCSLKLDIEGRQQLVHVPASVQSKETVGEEAHYGLEFRFGRSADQDVFNQFIFHWILDGTV